MAFRRRKLGSFAREGESPVSEKGLEADDT